jgi:hypothetical protein
MAKMNRPQEEIEKMVEQNFRQEVMKQKEKSSSGFKWFWESDSSDDEEKKEGEKKGFFSKMISNFEKNVSGDGKKVPMLLTPTS